MAAGKKGTTKTTRYREADKGRYGTKKYADTHPKTTVKETDRKKKN